MKLIFLLFAVIILSLFIEGTLISFPLFYLASFILLFQKKNKIIFTSVLLFGVMLDIIHLNALGITPLIIFFSYFLVMLYEKYFGSRDLIVALFIAIVGTLFYSYFLKYSLITTFWVMGMGVGAFLAFQFYLLRQYK